MTRTGTRCTQGSGSNEGAGSTSASKTLLHTPLIVSPLVAVPCPYPRTALQQRPGTHHTDCLNRCYNSCFNSVTPCGAPEELTRIVLLEKR